MLSPINHVQYSLNWQNLLTLVVYSTTCVSSWQFYYHTAHHSIHPNLGFFVHSPLHLCIESSSPLMSEKTLSLVMDEQPVDTCESLHFWPIGGIMASFLLYFWHSSPPSSLAYLLVSLFLYSLYWGAWDIVLMFMYLLIWEGWFFHNILSLFASLYPLLGKLTPT